VNADVSPPPTQSYTPACLSGFRRLPSYLRSSHLQMRSFNSSMGCSGTSSSTSNHLAANSGPCTRRAVRTPHPHWPRFLRKLNHSKVSCSDYLCEDTLVCVKRPIECPCPVVQDVKCIVPDTQDAGSGTRLCIRGGTDCAQIEKLVNKFAM
jgi:hypothetical protein